VHERGVRPGEQAHAVLLRAVNARRDRHDARSAPEGAA
jgi:hypothetical protein